MNFNIPKKVDFIINTFYENGFEAFLVGGCIRDFLLGADPKDYDIATSATPEETISLFEKTIPTGLQHGTVTVLIDSESFEVTTYRTESEYKDNRHPEKVTFVKNIKEDLSRRDLTINAFAYNKKEGLIDFFNGMNDLNNKIIRCVGDSNLRFNEDALRMLRAIRFSAKLNFKIEEKTLLSIEKNKDLIKNISGERIRDELCKILISDNSRLGLELLLKTGLLLNIIPEFKSSIEFNQYNHEEDIFNHTLSVIEKTPKVLNIRLAALFHAIGKPQTFTIDDKNVPHFYGYNIRSEEIARIILNRLRFDNKQIKEVTTLIREHLNTLDNPKSLNIKRLINRVSVDFIYNLYALQKAKILSLSDSSVAIQKLEKMIFLTDEILNSKQPLTIKDLDITGKDLIIEFKVKPGKKIGEILSYLLDLVLDNEYLNKKETLLFKAKEFLNE
ncbi:CCA tRNA nucleotidyltransferase [uncultured Clostridium sp.]|uniref:CCA tRNA nucleotidyltransferase n=1 Tax=uncultured Clostridium sp. TaxID=59620 RepID=UPI0026214C82|nr:CCA tRNA nucleotidyltransferase [uncultured Clostridium sp.]